mgnify:CR=1 FL=1
MKTMVDSSVWSTLFRKKTKTEADMRLAQRIERLSANDELIIIGAIRQETLSGVSSAEKFAKMKSLLSMYPDFPVLGEDYITAAEFFNVCRSHGIQGSHIDFLISAVAVNNGFDILTLDGDFLQYKRFVNISLAQL